MKIGWSARGSAGHDRWKIENDILGEVIDATDIEASSGLATKHVGGLMKISPPTINCLVTWFCSSQPTNQ